jgi:hypothetical protein
MYLVLLQVKICNMTRENITLACTNIAFRYKSLINVIHAFRSPPTNASISNIAGPLPPKPTASFLSLLLRSQKPNTAWCEAQTYAT